jgi:hypothetical protein
MYRSLRWTLGAVAVGATIALGAALSTASASPNAGTVHVWVTQQHSGGRGHILITGVIADHGTTIATTKAGKADAKGKYEKIMLKHGTFEVSTAALNKKFNKVQPAKDVATCSLWATASADVTTLDGTGAYAGISGKIRITTSFAEIAPRYPSGAKKGECDVNGRPVAEYNGALAGVGHVSL